MDKNNMTYSDFIKEIRGKTKCELDFGTVQKWGVLERKPRGLARQAIKKTFPNCPLIMEVVK